MSIPSAVARRLLPELTPDMAFAILESRGPYSESEKRVLYTHYLVARGDFHGLLDFLTDFTPAERSEIVNATHYETYFGNVLHTCAYWNTGDEGLAIYRYLVTCGAVATLDYYEQYPWAMEGIKYVCPLRGVDVAPDCDRDHAEFDEFHADILRFFGPERAATPVYEVDDTRPSTPELPMPPALTRELTLCAGGAGAGLESVCERHRPGAPYSRNTEGYYGSHVPLCNGCARRAAEDFEELAADRVRNLTYRLLQAWATRYDATSVAEAIRLAADLQSAVTALNELRTPIVTPQDQAERVLRMHAAALEVNTAFRNGAGDYQAAREHLNAFLLLNDRYLGDLTRYRIVAVVAQWIEMEESREDTE